MDSLTDKGKEQTKLALDSAEKLVSLLNSSTAREGNPVAAYQSARKMIEDITRYLEAAEAAVPPGWAENFAEKKAPQNIPMAENSRTPMAENFKAPQNIPVARAEKAEKVEKAKPATRK